MNDLTAFQRDLLWVVAGNDGAKGLKIKDEMEAYYGEELNHGRLYPNLDELIEKGLLEKTEEDGRTNAYHLTGRGQRDLESRREWQAETVGRGMLEA